MCYVTGWYRGEKRAMKFAIPIQAVRYMQRDRLSTLD